MATEKRLIDANALIEWLTKHNGFRGNCEDCTDIDCVDCIIENAIKNAPTVDAVPVVHGRWKYYHEADIGYDEYGGLCSNCGFEVEGHEVKFIMHYCPNCGAKMDGGSHG